MPIIICIHDPLYYGSFKSEVAIYILTNSVRRLPFLHIFSTLPFLHLSNICCS